MIKLNKQVAELLGAHVGDGTLYKTKSSTVWELRGALEEKEYYINNVCPLMNQIFNEEFISKFRNDGCKGVWGVQTSKKVVTAFFQEFGFKPGTKTYTVAVPKYVFSVAILPETVPEIIWLQRSLLSSSTATLK